MTAASALLWASSFSVVKVGLRHMDPYSFVLLRFLVASAILACIVVITGRTGLLARYMRDRYALLLGVTLAASFGLQFRGQTETTAAKAAMIINSSVVLIAPLSVMLLKETMGWRSILALAVGVCGVYLVTAARSGSPGETGNVRGDLLISGSSLSYALYVVFTKMAVTRRHFREVPLVAAVFIWSLPFFLAASLPSLASGLEIVRETWVATAYLAVFCSVLPFVIYTAAIKHIGALTSGIVLLAELVFGVLIAYVFLSESLSAGGWVGCALICTGIFIVGARPARPRGPGGRTGGALPTRKGLDFRAEM
jgi:drug/metabolite transporter (DMT)-like permease